LIIFVVWNGITFFLMGLDKYKAIHGKQRISEATLLTCAFALGGIGAWIGSRCFHHKTRKIKFYILLPAAVIFNGILLLSVLYFMKQ